VIARKRATGMNIWRNTAALLAACALAVALSIACGWGAVAAYDHTHGTGYEQP